MGKLVTVWKRISDISTAQWLWSLLPSSMASGLVGWLAHNAAQQAWLILTVMSVVFAAVSWSFAAWRSHRVSSVRESSFDDLRKRVRDEKLAEMLGVRDAEEAYNRVLPIGMLSFDPLKAMRRAVELDEAKYQGELAKTRRGEDDPS